MVLGLKTKASKSPSVHVNYIIHIQEIKPWPPSQSLRTLRAVLIQWEYNEKNSGLTNQVVPSIGTGNGVGDGRIEFNESFKLPVTLHREMSIRGGEESFQKNCIEFNLYEPRKGKAVVGQLLGTAILDLADFGIVKESLSVNTPIKCKRTYGNTAQPLLFLRIQPVQRRPSSSSSSRDSLMRETSMDRSHAESVSALMSEEYAEEAEASFSTDDDISSHSSLAIASSNGDSNGSSSPQSKEIGTVSVDGSTEEAKLDHVSDQSAATNEEMAESHDNSSRSSSMDLSSDLAWISKKITSRSLQSSAAEEMENQPISSNNSDGHEEKAEGNLDNGVKHQLHSIVDNSSNTVAKGTPLDLCLLENSGQNDSSADEIQKHEKMKFVDEKGQDIGGEASSSFHEVNMLSNTVAKGILPDQDHMKASFQNVSTDYEIQKDEVKIVEENELQIEDEPSSGFHHVSVQKQITVENDQLSVSKETSAVSTSFSNIDRPKSVKSVRSSGDLSRSSGSVTSNQFFVADAHNKGRESTSNDLKDGKVHKKERNVNSDGRIQQLENRIKVLEEELKEAAAIEVSLYSVVAEHGSSMNKVHAPARRLSRLYSHAIKQNSKARRGSAAKSVVSGIVLVAKACGNDVPRLTFWLSNSTTLRVIVERSCGDSQLPTSVGTGGIKNGNKKSLPLKWESFQNKDSRSVLEGSYSDWDNPRKLVAALEKVESWIFSRIIESIWWQTFTPHMQSGAAKKIRSSMDSKSGNLYRTSSSTEQQQGNNSLELWKKAFRDACESICPVRAEGHDCGCLPVLSKLIMEQLIARLDVAMFNAILRESIDDMPTDPIADPISDAEVLPIPPGKTSFGAGAQLKNAIGNWSRWLTDLFGIDDDFLENEKEEDDYDDERTSCDSSSKPFYLLNALSDLMMLPKDMLLSQTIRKEVCPTFGPPLIRRVLDSFVPDEFCPDPIPNVVLEAINSEDPFDCVEDSIMNFPCEAVPIIYQPPSAASVAGIFGEIGNNPKLTRSGSSVLKKSQTSDDELDELDSPLNSILGDGFCSSPSSLKLSKENGSAKALRYQLLREVWMNND